jgi:ABC-type glutathione transport system ATPase component
LVDAILAQSEEARAAHGQIVAAVGEAGAGKSRLVFEFKATVPHECKVLEALTDRAGKGVGLVQVGPEGCP